MCSRWYIIGLVSEIDPFGNSKHTYLQVADAIAARIEGGQITFRLPSERALAEEFKVAYMTVRRAMEVLRDRGVIITRQGRGTFVAAAVPRD